MQLLLIVAVCVTSLGHVVTQPTQFDLSGFSASSANSHTTGNEETQLPGPTSLDDFGKQIRNIAGDERTSSGGQLNPPPVPVKDLLSQFNLPPHLMQQIQQHIQGRVQPNLQNTQHVSQNPSSQSQFNNLRPNRFFAPINPFHQPIPNNQFTQNSFNRGVPNNLPHQFHPSFNQAPFQPAPLFFLPQHTSPLAHGGHPSFHNQQFQINPAIQNQFQQSSQFFHQVPRGQFLQQRPPSSDVTKLRAPPRAIALTVRPLGPKLQTKTNKVFDTKSPSKKIAPSKPVTKVITETVFVPTDNFANFHDPESNIEIIPPEQLTNLEPTTTNNSIADGTTTTPDFNLLFTEEALAKKTTTEIPKFEETIIDDVNVIQATNKKGKKLFQPLEENNNPFKNLFGGLFDTTSSPKLEESESGNTLDTTSNPIGSQIDSISEQSSLNEQSGIILDAEITNTNLENDFTIENSSVSETPLEIDNTAPFNDLSVDSDITTLNFDNNLDYDITIDNSSNSQSPLDIDNAVPLDDLTVDSELRTLNVDNNLHNEFIEGNFSTNESSVDFDDSILLDESATGQPIDTYDYQLIDELHDDVAISDPFVQNDNNIETLIQSESITQNIAHEQQVDTESVLDIMEKEKKLNASNSKINKQPQLVKFKRINDDDASSKFFMSELGSQLENADSQTFLEIFSSATTIASNNIISSAPKIISTTAATSEASETLMNSDVPDASSTTELPNQQTDFTTVENVVTESAARYSTLDAVTSETVTHDASVVTTEITEHGTTEFDSIQERIDETATVLMTDELMENNTNVEEPHIVERTVISITSNKNDVPKTKEIFIFPDVESTSDDLVQQQSEIIPTFTIVVDPETGRIFKRSIVSNDDETTSRKKRNVPTDEIVSPEKLSRRQGLLALFNERRKTKNGAKLSDKIKKEKAEEESRGGGANRGKSLIFSGNDEILESFQTETLDGENSGKSISLHRRLQGRKVMSDSGNSVTSKTGFTSGTELAENNNKEISENDAPTETVSPVSAVVEKKDEKKASNSLKDQIRSLLKNKNTEEKVRRRLLASRHRGLKKKDENNKQENANTSPTTEATTTKITIVHTPRPQPRLRFNRFRNRVNERKKQSTAAPRTPVIESPTTVVPTRVQRFRGRNRNRPNRPKLSDEERKRRLKKLAARIRGRQNKNEGVLNTGRLRKIPGGQRFKNRSFKNNNENSQTDTESTLTSQHVSTTDVINDDISATTPNENNDLTIKEFLLNSNVRKHPIDVPDAKTHLSNFNTIRDSLIDFEHTTPGTTTATRISIFNNLDTLTKVSVSDVKVEENIFATTAIPDRTPQFVQLRPIPITAEDSPMTEDSFVASGKVSSVTARTPFETLQTPDHFDTPITDTEVLSKQEAILKSLERHQHKNLQDTVTSLGGNRVLGIPVNTLTNEVSGKTNRFRPVFEQLPPFEISPRKIADVEETTTFADIKNESSAPPKNLVQPITKEQLSLLVDQSLLKEVAENNNNNKLLDIDGGRLKGGKLFNIPVVTDHMTKTPSTTTSADNILRKQEVEDFFSNTSFRKTPSETTDQPPTEVPLPIEPGLLFDLPSTDTQFDNDFKPSQPDVTNFKLPHFVEMQENFSPVFNPKLKTPIDDKLFHEPIVTEAPETFIEETFLNRFVTEQPIEFFADVTESSIRLNEGFGDFREAKNIDSFVPSKSQDLISPHNEFISKISEKETKIELEVKPETVQEINTNSPIDRTDDVLEKFIGALPAFVGVKHSHMNKNRETAMDPKPASTLTRQNFEVQNEFPNLNTAHIATNEGHLENDGFAAITEETSVRAPIFNESPNVEHSTIGENILNFRELFQLDQTTIEPTVDLDQVTEPFSLDKPIRFLEISDSINNEAELRNSARKPKVISNRKIVIPINKKVVSVLKPVPINPTDAPLPIISPSKIDSFTETLLEIESNRQVEQDAKITSVSVNSLSPNKNTGLSPTPWRLIPKRIGKQTPFVTPHTSLPVVESTQLIDLFKQDQVSVSATEEPKETKIETVTVDDSLVSFFNEELERVGIVIDGTTSPSEIRNSEPELRTQKSIDPGLDSVKTQRIGKIITEANKGIGNNVRNFTKVELFLLDVIAGIVDSDNPSFPVGRKTPIAETTNVPTVTDFKVFKTKLSSTDRPAIITTTSAPSTSTREPITTTRETITTTKEPITTTREPITTTRAPATTTRPPITTTRAPITTTRVPVTTTSAPFTFPAGPLTERPSIAAARSRPVEAGQPNTFTFPTAPVTSPTIDRSFNSQLRQTTQRSPFQFTHEFPFHVFDSLLSGEPVTRQRSVSQNDAGSRLRRRNISPNFSFFQMFNPPRTKHTDSLQSFQDKSKGVAEVLIGRPVVSPLNPNTNTNAVRSHKSTIPASRSHSNFGSQHSGFAHSPNTHILHTTNHPTLSRTPRHHIPPKVASGANKIVSMRTNSGSLFFVPESQVEHTMKSGLGQPVILNHHI